MCQGREKNYYCLCHLFIILKNSLGFHDLFSGKGFYMINVSGKAFLGGNYVRVKSFPSLYFIVRFLVTYRCD